MQHLLLFNRSVQYIQEIVVGVVHWEYSRLLQLLEKPLPVFRATHNQFTSQLRRVWDVHRVAIRENAVAVANIPQMLQPLYFIIGVIHEGLVKPR